jgi:hypothetical protein
MEPRKGCWCGLCQYDEYPLFLVAHPGDGISPGGFIRTVWGVELPSAAITSRPHSWLDIVRSRN